MALWAIQPVKKGRGNDGGSRGLPSSPLRGEDKPVLMLNMNRYTPEAGFPDEGLHHDYIAGLETFLATIGGKILWRHAVYGQIVGDQPLDEILAVWYPSHQAFVNLASAPGSMENYRLRAESVAYAVIHRCTGDQAPFCP